MQTKLTLRMDAHQILMAKTEASRRGKSVSRMVSDFFDTLVSGRPSAAEIPPITASLVGILKDHGGAVSDYRKHLRKKYM